MSDLQAPGCAIRLQWDDQADQTLALPNYATDGAAGADIRANLPAASRQNGWMLPPGDRCLVPAGFRMEIPAGFEAQVRPRSGLALKFGITVLNSPGTIDSDYRGPVGVVLINHGATVFKIEHGMRIAQMVIAPTVQADFARTSALSDTDRGSGGYGSTGQN